MAVTWNPSDKTFNVALSGGNLTATVSGAAVDTVRATTSYSTGKKYFEVVVSGMTSDSLQLGLLDGTSSLFLGIGDSPTGWALFVSGLGSGVGMMNNGTVAGSVSPLTIADGDVAGVAIDFGAGKIWFSYKGVWLLSGNPATGANPIFTGVSGTLFPAFANNYSPPVVGTGRFAASAFSYAVPSGFDSWEPSATVTAVGTAAGTSTANAGTPQGVGAAVGTSTAVAYSSASVGSSAGTSTALAEGIGAIEAVGTSVGMADAHGHKAVGTIYADNSLFVTGSMPPGTTVVGAYWDGSAWTPIAEAIYYNGSIYVPLALIDGAAPELLFYPPTHTAYNVPLAIAQKYVFRITIPLARWIAGTYVADADNNTTFLGQLFPAPTGTSYASTFPWDEGGGYAIYADGTSDRPYTAFARPSGGGDKKYAFADSFHGDAYAFTNQVDVLIDLTTAVGSVPALFALGFLVFGQTYVAEYVETANATANIELHHVVYASSTANATSVLSSFETQTEVSHANATSSVSTQTDVTLTLVSEANATSSVSGDISFALVSTANATSVVPKTPTIATYASIANAVSNVQTAVIRKNTCVSTANATSTVIGARVLNTSSTANVTSSVSGTRTQRETLVSSANVTSSATGSHGVSEVVLVSHASIASVISGKTYAHFTFVSAANIQAFILLPGLPEGLSSLWCNPITHAAASWSGTPFESVIEVDGVMYGAGAEGIYKMEDELDETTEVSAYVTWDLLDFGDPRKHRPGDFMITGTAGAPLKVTVANEQGRYSYLTHLPENTIPTNFRARLGKGLHSRHLRFTVENTKSKDFWFDAAEIEVIQLSRHIGGRHA